eukprot:COSAG03_NODE_29519_length_182_cov_532.409639_1_plen_35_part_10
MVCVWGGERRAWFAVAKRPLEAAAGRLLLLRQRPP